MGVYVNGKPFTARDPNNINFHLEMNNPEETSKLEAEFAEEVKKRGEDFKYYKDQFGEHPEERANNEEISEKLSGVTTLNEIYAAIKDKVPKLEPIRIPMNQEQAPAEENFDQIVAMLEDRNAMQMGEFEVIKELLAAFPEAKVAKAEVDKLIDLAAPPPRGTGVENIRECIIESKMTFDVSSDDWQAYLKAKIMNNIERYFYLIVFAMYIRELGPKGFPQTFKQYMDDHSGLRTMIEEGRGKLEWERKIPDEKLSELKDMLSSADFKANMPKVIKRIYELSWDMFGDLPRGHHKNNSMHKLASKTMIEILPENLAAHVEKKCGALAGTPDFFDVIGQVSWYEPEA